MRFLRLLLLRLPFAIVSGTALAKRAKTQILEARENATVLSSAATVLHPEEELVNEVESVSMTMANNEQQQQNKSEEGDFLLSNYIIEEEEEATETTTTKVSIHSNASASSGAQIVLLVMVAFSLNGLILTTTLQRQPPAVGDGERVTLRPHDPEALAAESELVQVFKDNANDEEID